ncbi:30S ribosomal protein S6 [Patescibacteria group bacterium]|nr:30S ribosomal protein S6 [Patescibacteria group bacterium]
MKNYELTYLISSDYSETDVAKVIAGITNFVREKEGSIKRTSEPSKIKLAYLVEKKAEAYLISTYFSLAPEKIAELEVYLKEKRELLRYILVVKKDIKEKLTKRRTKPQPVKELSEEEKEVKKVELQAIDDKIDEILK